MDNLTQTEIYNYLTGRRDLESVTFTVVEHSTDEDNGYIIEATIDHAKGKKTFLLAETYHTGKRGEIHTRQTLSKMLQAGVR
jgi:hypothetical protein